MDTYRITYLNRHSDTLLLWECQADDMIHAVNQLLDDECLQVYCITQVEVNGIQVHPSSEVKEAVFHDGKFYCPHCGKELTQVGEYVYRKWTSWHIEENTLYIHSSSDKMHWDASKDWGFDCLACDIHPIPAPSNLEIDYA